MWVLVLVGCAPVVEHPAPSAQDGDLPESELWHWTTVVARGGQTRAKVSADYLRRQSRDQQARFRGDVAVLFFNVQGDTVSRLHAQRGHIDASGDHMSVVGQVVVQSHDSTRLTTDSLRWDREEDRISGDGHVRIWRPDGEETGVGFEASSDLKRWTLKQVLTRVTR